MHAIAAVVSPQQAEESLIASNWQLPSIAIQPAVRCKMKGEKGDCSSEGFHWAVLFVNDLACAGTTRQAASVWAVGAHVQGSPSRWRTLEGSVAWALKNS